MQHLSWDDIDAAAQMLATQVQASGFNPEFLVGITTGGLIPLALLAKRLGIHEVLTICAKLYDAQEKKNLVVTHRPVADLKNRRVLLIDEIADSGETLSAITHIFENEYDAQVKTLVLVLKNTCPLKPDFSALITDQWIEFPWEKSGAPN